MNAQLQQEITSMLKMKFKQILDAIPERKGSRMFVFVTRPYISGAIISITEEMSARHGTSYENMLRIVSPIANRLKKEFFE